MLPHALLLALQLPGPAAAASAPPPIFYPYRRPAAQRMTAAWTCADGARELSLDTTPKRPPRLLAASRGGVAMPQASRDAVDAAIAPLAILAVQPECATNADRIRIIGLIGQRQHAVWVDWTGNEIRLRGPEHVRLIPAE
ncbi:hypothetical protein E2493_20160 [Sphingomonas parva]|uniref:Uncharacterized protein n=1 Tax=Sphingomonas parva TaxID=2555898 RepID=A0A4Y8ZKE3_9SPHN|nr:hypothetical protein [Sphingomonas parva]TFI56448.1 hypothetical protein E2493_20160 [Sphingomonas parva]